MPADRSCVSLRAANQALLGAVGAGLAAVADPERAADMQRYMKSAMPFRGVPSPEQRRIFRDVFAAHPLESWSEWHDTVLALWRGAEYREERYAAIALTGARAYRDHQTRETLAMYEELVVTGAWWDYVDAIAAHRLGRLLERFPRFMAHRMRQWAHHPDLWKRRSAILCQLRFGAATDRRLLWDCIEPSISDHDFFARKAIGWALREYAKAEPAAVIAYVRARADELSGLSKREALRRLLAAGTIDEIP